MEYDARMDTEPVRLWSYQYTDKEGHQGLLTHEHEGGRSFIPAFPSKMLAEMELEDVRNAEPEDSDVKSIDIIEIEVRRV